MKFSILAISLFAAAGLAAPVAEAEAAPAPVAEAAPAPVAEAEAEAEADPEATFLSLLFGLKSHLFGLNAYCNTCNGVYSGVSLGVNANIFITPTGDLIYGNTIPGSVPVRGTIINGNYYVNSPFIGNGLGAINYNGDGRLYVGPRVRNSFGWYRRNKDIFCSLDNIYACPDDHGHHYIYYGKHHHHHHRKVIRFHWY